MSSRLRTQRGLTQAALAERVGCDLENIARVEQGRGKWSEPTAELVIRALHAKIPVAYNVIVEFAALTGLDPGIADVLHQEGLTTDRIARIRVESILHQLIDAVGVETAEQLLVSALAVSTASRPGRRLTVVSRPREARLGDTPAVEQVYTDYEIRDDEDDAAKQGAG